MYLNDKERKVLEDQANKIRKKLIETLETAGSGHSAGPLDLADIFTALYFADLLKKEDKVVLSCGHTCPILYTTLIHAGVLRKDELLTLRKLGTRLQGHPHHEQVYPGKEPYHENTPGVENSAGPLGQGMSVGVGMALAGKRVYLIGSDGELNEGQTWEAIMMMGNKKLSNLTYIIDRNNIQIDGYTEKVQPLEPLFDKLKAFNLHVLEIDGNSMEQIIAAVHESWTIKDKSTVILANTIPGKGVEYMEGEYIWHGTPPGASNIPGEPPKEKQAEEALKSLRTLGGKIQSEHE